MLRLAALIEYTTVLEGQRLIATESTIAQLTTIIEKFANVLVKFTRHTQHTTHAGKISIY
jgi:hypothetical protein